MSPTSTLLLSFEAASRVRISTAELTSLSDSELLTVATAVAAAR